MFKSSKPSKKRGHHTDRAKLHSTLKLKAGQWRLEQSSMFLPFTRRIKMYPLSLSLSTVDLLARRPRPQSTRSKHATATTPGFRYKLGGNAADTMMRPNNKRETMSHLRSILDLSALPETLLSPGKTGETFLLLVAPERRQGQPCLRLFFLSSSS